MSRAATKRATLADVAALAEVSVATASKALSGNQRVSRSAKTRVLKAAEKLGYKANRNAQNLATGRSRTVGLVTHDLEGRFSIPILMGAEDTFGMGKVSVLLCDARGDSIREQYHVDALLSSQVDGLIVVGARSDPRPSLGELPVPVVYAYAPSEDPADMSVEADNRDAGRLAARHLLDLGMRKIALISGDRTYGASRDRVVGALEALQEEGLRPAGGETLFGSWTESWGRAATRGLLERSTEFDSVLCGSDQVARGVMDSLREANLKIPEDVMVIGHDNWEAIALGARPPLTSVDMRLEEVGHQAARLLLEAMGGVSKPGSHFVQSQIIVRESTSG